MPGGWAGVGSLNGGWVGSLNGGWAGCWVGSWNGDCAAILGVSQGGKE